MSDFVNAYRTGDLFWSIQFLRNLEGQHNLYCRPDFSDFLAEYVAGTNITLLPIEGHPDTCIDLWIGSGSNEFNWYSHHCPKDLMGFLVEFYGHICDRLGVKRVITNRRQLLATGIEPHLDTPSFDILMIDADPQSSQCEKYAPDEMVALVAKLRQRYTVQTVKGQGLTLMDIGRLSHRAKVIAGVATGPMWMCLNEDTIWRPRMLVLDQAYLDYKWGTPIQHFADVAELEMGFHAMDWL